MFAILEQLFLIIVPVHTTRLMVPMNAKLKKFLMTMFHVLALTVCFVRIVDALVQFEDTFETPHNAWFVYAVAFNAKIIIGISQIA